MPALGAPTRRNISVEELLRTTLNEILKEKIKNQAMKATQPVAVASMIETVYLADATTVITTTTGIGNYVYDDANSKYDQSDYA